MLEACRLKLVARHLQGPTLLTRLVGLVGHKPRKGQQLGLGSGGRYQLKSGSCALQAVVDDDVNKALGFHFGREFNA